MRAQTYHKPYYSQEHECWAIPLSQGAVALVDADMTTNLGEWGWYSLKTKRQLYAVRRGKSQTGKRTMIYMHRVIMDAPSGIEVDHRTHHPLEMKLIDNRRANLRLCTPSQNVCNRRPWIDGSSKFKGVSWHPSSNRWTARIQIDGKRKSLGFFADQAAAARAYDAAALEKHGEFALTNSDMGLL